MLLVVRLTGVLLDELLRDSERFIRDRPWWQMLLILVILVCVTYASSGDTRGRD